MWLSFPPIGISGLVWIAPVPILTLVLLDPPSWALIKRPYRKIWLATSIYWLATFYFLPWPHPVLYIGWFALSGYLAIYTPLMVVVSRVMIHRWSISPVVAIPVAWTGFEWIRVNFLTGFGMVCLSHSQAQHPSVIQIAELFGAYTVTFFIVLIASAFAVIVQMVLVQIILPARRTRTGGTENDVNLNRKQTARVALPAVSVLILAPIAVLVWGNWRLGSAPVIDAAPADATVRIVLIQSSIDTVLRPSLGPEEAMRIRDEEFAQRIELTHQARKQSSGIDLIVWPESAFPTPDHVETESMQNDTLAYAQAIAFCHEVVTTGQGEFEAVPMVTGTTTFDTANDGIYNAAILIDRQGRVSNRYLKHHRVMIGEYLPVIEYFPSLARLSPVGRGLTPGREFSNFSISDLNVAPNICFETTVPHFIRRQVNTLTRDGTPPDVMLNITNDGWFFGSACLDFHFACNVFRAVEMRTQMLVCANTGFSAQIDAWGRVVKKGSRRQPDILVCDVPVGLPPESSATNRPLYQNMGDLPVVLMGLVNLSTLLWAGWMRQRERRDANQPGGPASQQSFTEHH